MLRFAAAFPEAVIGLAPDMFEKVQQLSLQTPGVNICFKPETIAGKQGIH